MTKPFAIRMPKESTADIGAFVPWIIGHISPAIPVEKTKTIPQALFEVFKNLQEELVRFTDYERLKLRHENSDFQGDYTKELHSKWLSLQNLELHLTLINPGTYNVSAVLFGPEYLPLADKGTEADINIGYETIFQFYIQMCYEEAQDTYWVKLLPFDLAKVPSMDPGQIPLTSEPDFNISIEQNEKRKSATELFNLYHDELQKSVERYAESLKIELSEEVKSQLSVIRLMTDNLSESSKALSGGLYDPIRFSAYGFSLPTKNGFQLFSVVGFNIGRQYNIPMPVIFINKKES